MGLLDIFLPGNPVSPWLDQNRNKLTGAFGGLVGHGNDPRAIMSGAVSGMQQGQPVDQQVQMIAAEEAKQQAAIEAEQAQQQQTVEWLQQQGFEDLAEYARAGNGGEAWKLALERMNPETAGGDEENFFGNVIPFEVEGQGVQFGQVGNRGSFRPLQLPEGGRPAPTTRTVDTPTEVITQDIYGNELFRTPKDLRGAEREKAIGGVEGAAIAGASADIDAGETALHIIDQIKTHPELEWATGPAAAMGGNNAVLFPQRYGFQRLVDQAKSGAFLTAIQEMRGLGALSNAEGQTATAAVTRMETALRKEDFLQALADYEAIIRRGMERANARLQAGGGTPGGNVTSTGLSWSVSP
jgi:hypothetical protein